jgi:hypothetical protein
MVTTESRKPNAAGTRAPQNERVEVPYFTERLQLDITGRMNGQWMD